MSRDSVQSLTCLSELQYAAALGKPIIPVRVDSSLDASLVPSPLAQLSWLSYGLGGAEVDAQLVRAIRETRRSTLPDPLPPAPEVPLSFLNDVREVLLSPSLSIDQQSAVLHQLEPGLSQTDTQGGARELLRRLSSRPDVAESIHRRIEDLLGPDESNQADEREPAGSSEAQATVFGLISRHGQIAAPNILDFVRLAAAVQYERRFRLNVSDVSELTRSTSLWTVAHLNHDIARILDTHGLSEAELTRMLSLIGAPDPSPVDDAAVHEELARAL